MPRSLSSRSPVGRPIVADHVRLDARISAACTHEQAARVRAAAKSTGLTISEFVLYAALGIRVQRVVSSEWRQVWSDLAPLASNLHQLVRHLNYKAVAGEVPDINTFADLAALAPRLHELVVQLRKTLVPVR